ncbi:hypothetical protein ACIPR7_16210 [Pectobacterium parvum]|uniref:hypothetical protein n=1 Tax=Pectobacterium TaxID=122277 RepID=UPI001F0BE884|nr:MULTISPECIES: hypothetical protein [Pectobacterium]UMO86133.1 hypothetical protein HP572_11985 [Pectobacterium sp. PL64]
MIDETLEEKVSKLEARIEDLVTENEVQKALLLGLMGELGTEKLGNFSTFRNVVHAELEKQTPQTDKQFYFHRSLTEYLKRALLEAKNYDSTNF